ncbi:MAG: hypothetical protein ACPG4W_06950 [Flavobacteriales bacterium]
MKLYSLILVLTLSLLSCTDNQNNRVFDVADEQSEYLDLNYFEQAFYSIPIDSFSRDLASLKSSYDLLFYTNQPDELWLERRRNADLQALSDTLNLRFKHHRQWQSELQTAMENYRNTDSNHTVPRLILWNSSFEMQTGVLNYENNVLVGMEHYLGERHPLYGDLPRYQAMQKDLRFLPTDIILSLADSKLEGQSSNQNFLSQMIREGKKAYFAYQLLEYNDESRVFKYNDAQFDWAKANEAEIWKFFIKQDYLYATEQSLVNRFLADAPFSKFGQSFDRESPGRIARWIGFKIVESYMATNNMSLDQLMSQQSSAQEFLQASTYKP